MGFSQVHDIGLLTLGVDAERTSFVVYTTTSGWKESQSQSDLLLAAAGELAVTMETCKAWSMVSHCFMSSSFTSAILQQHYISNVTFTRGQALVGRFNPTASYIMKYNKNWKDTSTMQTERRLSEMCELPWHAAESYQSVLKA